jgi:protein-disulfide isomerase
MKKIALLLLVMIAGFSVNLFADNSQKIKRISEGEQSAKITIITYESLTCGHCADFHKNVYPKLKKDFIDTGLVKIQFRNFPLDLVAFNASKIAHCGNTGSSKILHKLFKDQKKWVKGNNIEAMSESLKKYSSDFLIYEMGQNYEKCLSNKSVEDHVLNDRIEGVKKFKVNATPTIIINEKKFDKPINYKNLKKYLEKLI